MLNKNLKQESTKFGLEVDINKLVSGLFDSIRQEIGYHEDRVGKQIGIEDPMEQESQHTRLNSLETATDSIITHLFD